MPKQIAELYDSAERRITYLRVSLTDRCNYRCSYCMPREGAEFLPKKDILNYEELEGLLELFTSLGIRKIRFTGGEPLARKDASPFMARIAKRGLFEEVTLSTNGHFFTPYAKELRQAGLRRVNFSLDSLNPLTFQKITHMGRLETVLESIDAARTVGFDPVKLNTVVMKGVNDDEVEALLDFAVRKGLHLRFIETMPLGTGSLLGPEAFYPVGLVRRRCEAVFPLSPCSEIPGNGPATNYRVEGTDSTVGFIGALTENFCARCNRMRLSAFGDLYPCLDHDFHVSLRDPLRRGADDAELAALIYEALGLKPEAHTMTLGRAPDAGRPMHAIGG